MILSVSLKMNGAAELSGINVAGWKRPYEAVAMLARCISSHYVAPSGLTALTACRLVALDKCPGKRPIGIGEVWRKIVGKAIL